MLGGLLIAAALGVGGGEAAAAKADQFSLCRIAEEIVFDAATADGERVSVCSAPRGAGGRRVVLRYGRTDRLLCERTNTQDGDRGLVSRRYTRPRVTYLSLEARCESFDLEVSEAYEAEGEPIWLTELFVKDGASEDNGHGERLLPTTVPLALIAVEAHVVNLPFDR